MFKAVIDLNKLLENVNRIKEESNKDIIMVVKSNAYNAGAIEVTKFLSNNGVNYFAVVDALEAKELIEAKINANILILNSLEEEDLDFVINHENIILTVNNMNDVQLLNKYSESKPIRVHLQIETGMNRIGIKNINEANAIINILKNKKNIILEGIYTHYTSLENYQNQEKIFIPFTKLYDFKMIHCAASSTHKVNKTGNFVRVGIDAYGDNENTQSMTIVASIIAINELKKGESVGYAEEYKADEDCRIAVIPVGYNDGLRRALSGGSVLINNKLYKVVGRICMNHTFILVDNDITLNDKVYLTSLDYPATLMADYLQTITDEIFCMFKIRNREYVK